MEELIKETLRNQLSASFIEVINDSELHIGHTGSSNGAGHYTVKISSPLFEGLNRVNQHRLVYDALSAWIPKKIHALAIIVTK